MDTSQKKRSIFGSLNFWGRNQVVPTDPEQRSEFYRTADMSNTPPIPRVGFNASPESPAKRASAAQLSNRKIIDRPQGPSSKLSQSINATDFARIPSTPRTTNFSTGTTSTPKAATITRMPGDNPNKSNFLGISANNRRVANLSGAATTPRNMFRSSALNERPSFSFSPRVPHNTIKESFPPTTPGRAPRGSTAEMNGRALTHTTSANLFAMRIPSPPHDLTGERLAKEVPENYNRAGSIYADEFLTDYCPPDFDDLQRRQFFCILDLRRLKYAADEVFAKKDWKINILNFAKEYEKSRSLIMLRYGLYEFKTVKASEAIRKQWQKEHGIPTSDDEKDEKDAAPSHKTNGTRGTVGRGGLGKRKAEDELASKDNVLLKSSTNLNKRRVADREPVTERATVPSNKVKRKAEEVGEPDENHPSKLQKPMTASQQTSSSVKSIFEKIANGTLNESTATTASPSKQFLGPGSTLPGAAKQVNGGLGRSILDAGSKPSTSNNIFGHLSDASKGSGNDDADAESEASTDSEAEVDEESEVRETSQSKEASVAASGGASTPQFGAGTGLFTKKPIDNAPSSASSETGESTKGRSLFDRLTYGNDGQPVRVLTPQPEQPKEPTPEKQRSASPLKGSNGTPINSTWNTDTPIKFAPALARPSSSTLNSTAQKPAGSLFATKEVAASIPAVNPEVTEPPKQAEEISTPPAEASKSATPQPFLSKSPAPFPSSAAPAFGSTGAKAADIGSQLASPAAVPFGQWKPAEGQKDTAVPAPASSASSLFSTTSKPSEPETAKPASVFQSATLFGNTAKADESKPPSSQPNPLFGAAAIKFPQPSAPATPAASIFANSTPKPASSLFGSTAAPSASTAESTEPQTKPLFGTTSNQPTGSIFGTNAAKPAPTPEPKNPFGAVSAAPTPKPVFGGTSASQDEPAKSQPSIFANAPAASAPASTGSIFPFGGPQSTAPAPQFGAGASQQNAAQPGASSFGNGGGSSFTFSAGGAQQSSFNNPFASNGGTSAPASFNFGNNSVVDTASQTSASPFTFGAPNITFGGGSGASAPAAQPANMFGGAANGGSGTPSFSFGANSSQPGASSIFSQQKPAASIFAGSLAPPAGGTSTGTSKSPPLPDTRRTLY